MEVEHVIDITAEERETVLSLLEQHLPGAAAWVYGSRAKWTSRPQSDLDLVVFPTSEQRKRVGDLREAFEESNLPFRVDLFVWDEVPEPFRPQIEVEHLVLVRDGSPMSLDILPPGWERSTLGAACERGGGNIQTGPFGSQLHASDYRPFGVPSIMPQNIGDNRVIEDGIARIGEGDARRLARYLVRPGDIVYSRRGDVERRALIGHREDGWLCGTGCLRVRLGENGVNSQYASYYLGHPVVREWIVRHAHGATMPNLNTAILSACPFLIPPLSEQRAIAHVLGTLDDKIELNRRMNETLEAMARALFKSWFVDFDPVRAKMKGCDPGLPKEVAKLFPDRLVNSELGGMPEGWTVSTLGAIATSPRKGIDPKTIDASTPYFGLEHIPRRSVALVDWGTAGSVSSTKSSFEKGDILFGKLRPYFHKVGIAPVDGICSTDILVLKPRTSIWAAFVLACASSAEFVNYTSQTATGTKMPRTSWQIMSRYELCQPTDLLAQEFQQAVTPMHERVVSNIFGSRVLGVLRDTLLHKLVSGEVRVRDAEEFAAKIA